MGHVGLTLLHKIGGLGENNHDLVREGVPGSFS